MESLRYAVMQSFNLAGRTLGLTVLINLVFVSIGPGECKAQASAAATVPANAVGVAGKNYAGSIAGKYPITMRLWREGTALTGSYAYTKVGQDIRIAGSLQANGTFYLQELDDKGQVTGYFEGIIRTDGNIKGSWRKPGSDKTLSLALRETPIGIVSAAEAVTITEYSFSVQGPNGTESDYSFPRVTGPAQHPGLAKLKAQLTVTKLTEQTEQEIRETYAKCGCGLVSANYTVDYNRNRVLALSIHREWLGAYLSFSTKRLVLSTSTGERLSIKQLLLPAALPKLAGQCNKLLQARMQVARQEAGEGDEAKWLDELLRGKTFTTAHLDNFTVTKEGITFYYPFEFPNAVLALQPDDSFMFSFSELKPYVKPDGPLADEIK